VIEHHVAFDWEERWTITATGQRVRWMGCQPWCSCGERARSFFGKRGAERWARKHAGGGAIAGAQGGLF
jgi:hypothetical protein